MSIYLCSVTNRFPENYEIGLHARRWGVEEKYASKIRGVRKGDTLVFLVGGDYRSVHQIESGPIIERNLLWPPKDGSVFPHRIEIGPALYRGRASGGALAKEISFMKDKQVWTGTVQGGNGIFNNRLTSEDLAAIQRELHPVMVPQEETPLPEPARVKSAPEQIPRERQQMLFQFYSADLERAMISLLPRLGLRPIDGNGKNLPHGEKDTSRMVCLDSRGHHVVVHLHCGNAPVETLLHLLHDISWVRQNLDNVKEVRALLLTETLEPTLKDLISEVPNIEARTYRLAIELDGGQVA